MLRALGISHEDKLENLRNLLEDEENCQGGLRADSLS